jgi:putative nucleotidyltransferase with HDIG domain
MTAAFRRWFLRLIGRYKPQQATSAARAEPAALPSRVHPAIAAQAHPAATADNFDLYQGALYAKDDRRTLSEQDRRRLGPLKVRVAEVFHRDRAEIAAFPARAAHILRVLDEPDFDIDQLVRLTQQDPAISASILRAANSAAFAGVTRIETVRDAVVRLGAQTVAGIATAVTARGLFDGGPTRSRFEDAWNRLWHHSVTTAFTAGGYASASRRGNLERCFLGGMLHDIGKTFVLRALGHPSVEAVFKEEVSAPLLAAVLEDLHVEIGHSMAARWNLPDFVVHACAHHHELPSGDEGDLNIVRVVSGLDEISVNAQFREGLDDEVRRAAEKLALDGYALRALASERRDYAAKAASL